MKQLPRFLLLAPSLVGAVLACGPSAMKPPVTESHQEGCGGLGGEACGRARGLLAAATSFSNVEHSYLLDPTSSFAPGRALVRADAGMWSALPSACANPRWSWSSSSACGNCLAARSSGRKECFTPYCTGWSLVSSSQSQTKQIPQIAASDLLTRRSLPTRARPIPPPALDCRSRRAIIPNAESSHHLSGTCARHSRGEAHA